MEPEAFQQQLEMLASAFDKPVKGKAGMMAEYYNVVGRPLADSQIDRLFSWAKISLDKFPSISVLRTQAVEFGFLLRRNLSTAPRVEHEPLVVSCFCGEFFAALRADLANDDVQLKCTSCGQAYSARALKAHEDDHGIATFTSRPPQPVSKEPKELWWQEKQEEEEP